GAKRRYAFVNAHGYNVMWGSASYREALESADALFPDGTGVRWAARWAGERADNLNGTDMFPLLCRAARDAGLSVFLLGARPGIAERVAQTAGRLAPGLRIAGTHHGYFDADSAEERAVIDQVNGSGADILLVATGVPHQDEWLARHHAHLSVGAALGVGGLFDFYSGRIPRAPRWLRELGGEWLFRLYQEPMRLFRRYVVGNPAFLAPGRCGWRWSTTAPVGSTPQP
ncbi:MAG: WecB/TagA/CpsF family glycosyltransferase, partial [Pseudomonadota bacterium]